MQHRIDARFEFGFVFVLKMIQVGLLVFTLAFPFEAVGAEGSSPLPYFDTSLGRDDYHHSSFSDNESRLYDFYSRQAAFHLAQPSPPDLLPAFPGLDKGEFGHWGRHSKMARVEDRWSKLKRGPAIAATLSMDSGPITKAIVTTLSTGKDSRSACFDPLSLGYRAIWKGDLTFPALRWGLMGAISPDSEPFLNNATPSAWIDSVAQSYAGYYQFGNQTVFRYTIDGAAILDLLASDGSKLSRTLEFIDDSKSQRLALFEVEDDWEAAEHTSNEIQFETESGALTVSAAGSQTDLRVVDGAVILKFGAQRKGSLVTVSVTLPGSTSKSQTEQAPKPSHLIQQAPSKWDAQIQLQGEVRAARDGGPYAIDTLPVPLINPYFSPMFLTGIDFFENGDAAVCTFYGDVWIVSGIDNNLRSVRWKRFATGLNQPLGLTIIGGKIHTIGRDQITRLHDQNNDFTADYYECFFNDFTSSIGSHDFNTGLETDAEGNLYFASKTEGIVKVSPNGETGQRIGSGIRNPNGLAVSSAGRVYTSPQEGQWTPASMIIDATGNGFFGFQIGGSDREIDLPLSFIPRGIDNSTGGQVFADPDRWGPLSNKLLSLSYGYCSYYLVLIDQNNGQQGAIVPLKGEFLSGVHRGSVNPSDGQLYLVGTQGWGTYARFDGNLERVRYTGNPSYYPISYSVGENSIRLNFSEPLAKAEDQAPRNHFAQQWNYQYSPAYGSPEFSLKHPEKVGHDRVAIVDVALGTDGESLILSFEDLQPCMQMHLHLNPKFATGNRETVDFFLTLNSVPKASGALHLTPRVKGSTRSQAQRTSQASGETKAILLSAISGSAYSKSSFSIRAGQQVSLSFTNTDTKPHNWILADSGSYQELGTLSENMARSDDADAYIPDSPEVLAHSRLLAPGESQTILFQAPQEPGTYVYFSSHRGEWKTVKGTLIVY